MSAYKVALPLWLNVDIPSKFLSRDVELVRERPDRPVPPVDHNFVPQSNHPQVGAPVPSFFLQQLVINWFRYRDHCLVRVNGLYSRAGPASPPGPFVVARNCLAQFDVALFLCPVSAVGTNKCILLGMFSTCLVTF